MGLVWDCFPFFNEVDLLALRLEELDPVVDMFVITESDTTFRGNPKPYNFLDHIDRFDPWIDKIVYYPIKGADIDVGSSQPHEPWMREYHQRNALDVALKEAGVASDDTIILSDLDEIPRRESVAYWMDQAYRVIDLSLLVYCYGINIFTNTYHTIKMFPYKAMTTPQEIRRREPQIFFGPCGWEFSSLGTPEQISYKLKNFAHYEIDVPDISSPEAIAKKIATLEEVTGSGWKYERVEIDDTWPEAVKRDREYWSKYEW